MTTMKIGLLPRPKPTHRRGRGHLRGRRGLSLALIIRGSDERPARRLPRAAAEANRAADLLRAGGDLDAMMQRGSGGGRGARGGAKRI